MDVETLVRRATAGLTLQSDKMFKPSLTYAVLNNPYRLWCDYHAPRSEAVDESTKYDELKMKWGQEFEAKWVKERYPGVLEIKPRWGIEAVQATAKAMVEGVHAIYQPQLWDLKREIYGLGDVLVRDNSAPSDLGPYHYRVQELKRSKSVQRHHALQAVFYNDILGTLQGYAPPTVEVVLPSGSVQQAVTTVRQEVDLVLDQWRRIRNGTLKPELPGYDEAGSPWRVWTNKILDQSGDLTLLPPISSVAKRKLSRVLGVARREDLDRFSQVEFQRALGPTVGLHCYLKLRAVKQGMPILLPGATLAIPRRKRHVYFDFETCEDIHPSVPAHVYMIGAYDLERGAYRVFVARGADEEARIFRDFASWLGNPDAACLYHWTSYEVGQMRQVEKRHPELASIISGLTRACVDLKELIAKKVFFGTRTYSIKQVAPFLGFNWRQKDVGAFESMVLYWEWLDDQDSGKIEKVILYNEDDCMAMLHIDNELERRFGTAALKGLA